MGWTLWHQCSDVSSTIILSIDDGSYSYFYCIDLSDCSVRGHLPSSYPYSHKFIFTNYQYSHHHPLAYPVADITNWWQHLLLGYFKLCSRQSLLIKQNRHMRWKVCLWLGKINLFSSQRGKQFKLNKNGHYWQEMQSQMSVIYCLSLLVARHVQVSLTWDYRR